MECRFFVALCLCSMLVNFPLFSCSSIRLHPHKKMYFSPWCVLFLSLCNLFDLCFLFLVLMFRLQKKSVFDPTRVTQLSWNPRFFFPHLFHFFFISKFFFFLILNYCRGSSFFSNLTGLSYTRDFYQMRSVIILWIWLVFCRFAWLPNWFS
jgi:hypothetical protein